MKLDPRLRLVVQHLKHHKSLLVSALGLRLAHETLPMQVPVLTGAIVSVLAGEAPVVYAYQWPDAAPREALGVVSLGLLALAVLYGYGAYARQVASARLGRSLLASLRKAVTRKLLMLDAEQQRNYGTGELLDRALTDTSSVRRFTEDVFVHLPSNVLRIVYPTAMLLACDAVLAGLAFGVLVPQWSVARYLQKKLHRATRRTRSAHSELATHIKEHSDAIETVQALNGEQLAAARMERRADELERAELRARRLSATINGSVLFTTSLGLALTWWQGGLRVLQGSMAVGTLVTFCGFVVLLYAPIRRFTKIAHTCRRGLVSLERLSELLQRPEPLRDRAGMRDLEVSRGAISLEAVSVKHGGRRILDGIDLHIDPGLLTAVVGRSGAGKTTLLRCLDRLQEPDAGRVFIDGQELAQARHGSVRSQVAFVPQQPMVFTGTILDNIRLFQPEASAADVRAACDRAHATEFIERLPTGFGAQLGRRGTDLLGVTVQGAAKVGLLSGGELQRLAIARALLAKPKVLLLDEPTSALDPGSGRAVLAALRELSATTTIVVVAHHLQTARSADAVVVLDGGKVVAQGTHRQLRNTCSIYQTLFNLHAEGVSHLRRAL
ncbi:MAG: ABC transporter ATP-binding protein/permease [Proteobacteria bacterium]|nr:ABC transporter ATP-binding protein/permease [Pseudomonadota bacterium]